MAFVGGLVLTIAGGIILGVVGLLALPILLAGLAFTGAKAIELLTEPLDALDFAFFLSLAAAGTTLYFMVDK
jgi:hypothetical protein